MHQRIDQLDIEAAKKDIRPFIKDVAELDLWSKDFFLQVIQRLRVLPNIHSLVFYCAISNVTC
jgi:hypothetical protein